MVKSKKVKEEEIFEDEEEIIEDEEVVDEEPLDQEDDFEESTGNYDESKEETNPNALAKLSDDGRPSGLQISETESLERV